MVSVGVISPSEEARLEEDPPSQEVKVPSSPPPLPPILPLPPLVLVPPLVASFSFRSLSFLCLVCFVFGLGCLVCLGLVLFCSLGEGSPPFPPVVSSLKMRLSLASPREALPKRENIKLIKDRLAN